MKREEKPILVTGATGYVGGRLVPRLLEEGYRVRAVGRSLEKLRGRHWAGHRGVELKAVDVRDFEGLKRVLQGCGVAYYFVHSMVREEKAFEKADREAALNFVAAAEEVGLERIVYLGGLGSKEERLSRHLQSRHEVGEIFQLSEVKTTVLRAAMIIGAGSASFEILRYLVEHLPVMITPRWVRTEVQPISIRDVLSYLVGVLEKPETAGQTYDIGGPRITTYEELMQIYTEATGLHPRKIIRVGVLSPRLSSYWIGLVTPLPARLGRPLVEGLRNRVVCEETRIREVIPIELLDYREAIKRAVDKDLQNSVETSWSDAGRIPPAEWADSQDPKWAGGTIFREHREITIEAPPEAVWKAVLEIGGKKGWYSTSWLWKVRGALDKLVGGVGLRRGRRDREELLVGDAVDFWRVRSVEKNRRLLFVAEMRLPGEATLEFQLTPLPDGKTRLAQTARFRPAGLLGLLYWWVVSPFHLWIFPEMLKKIAQAHIRHLDGGK